VITAGIGSVAGAAIGLGIADAAFGLSARVVGAAAAAALGGTVVALAATITVLICTAGRPLTAALASDD
jgi:hypothetical protein